MASLDILSAGWESKDWSILIDWSACLTDTAYYAVGGVESYRGNIYNFVLDAAEDNNTTPDRLSAFQLAHVNYIAKSLILNGCPNIADPLYPEEYDDDLFAYESTTLTQGTEALNG